MRSGKEDYHFEMLRRLVGGGKDADAAADELKRGGYERGQKVVLPEGTKVRTGSEEVVLDNAVEGSIDILEYNYVVIQATDKRLPRYSVSKEELKRVLSSKAGQN